MSHSAARLVGRSAELGLLQEAVAQIEDGCARAIEVVGAPGIGKTRLLAEVAACAKERSHLVLSGCGAELERDLPFWVFVDALDEYVGELEPRRLSGVDDDVLGELGLVFPSLFSLVRDRPPALHHERYRTHRAVRLLLERLAMGRSLVVLLDDFHWADDASVDLMGALLNRPPAAGVLLVLAARPRQLPPRLATALDRAHRAGTLDRIELGALSREDSGAFVGRPTDDPVTRALYEDSGGNPFYLEQLARSPGRPRHGSPAEHEVSLAGLQVPPMVAAALSEELGLLSDAARRVLEGASVAGDPFEPELAAVAAAVPEATAVEALDDLLRLDLVRIADVPRRFRFRHPIVRRAVYEAAPAGWRLGAHGRTAGELAGRGAAAGALAHHVEHSAREGDRAAVTVLREAGEQAARRAPATATRWLSGAIRLLAASSEPHERIELLLLRASAFASSGRFADSHADLLESVALAPDESTALAARLAALCARVEHLLGLHDEAHERLQNALAALPDAGSAEAVALMIELSMEGAYRMDYQAMPVWGRRAAAAARLTDDGPLEAAAVAALARAGAFAGDIVQAEVDRARAASIVDSMSDEQLARRLDAVAHLAGSELYLDRYGEAIAHANRALAVGRATGQGELFPLVLAILGIAWCIRGELSDAADPLDGAVEAARLSANRNALAYSLFGRSLIALAAGDVEIARICAEESLELTWDGEANHFAAWAAFALGGALLQSGKPERAAEVLVSYAVGDDLRRNAQSHRALYLELLTRCWLADGRADDAGRAAAAAVESAAAVGLPLAQAMADRAVAAVALHKGDSAMAAERALASAEGAERVGAPIEAALARTLAGRALAQAADAERAAVELDRAASQLDRCGAVRYRDEAEQELRRLGHHIHRRTRAAKPEGVGVDALTERELQIARLVVDRRTNKEIAAELFLSPKTIEVHLRNMFGKLNVESRVDVARLVEQWERLTKTGSG